MIKKLVLFFNLLFPGLLGLSQTYEPFISETRQWKYVEEVYLNGNSSQPLYRVTIGFFNGDTLIESALYNKFYHKSIIFDTTTTLTYCLSEDTINQQVLVHDPLYNKTVLLYDLSISEGDSFDRYILHDTYIKLKALKVDTVVTPIKELKRIVFNDSTTWIEGIGDITPTRIPAYGELICVKENELVLYLNGNYHHCDTIFPQGTYDIVGEIKVNENITLFPIPIESTSILEVNSKYTDASKIEIYNNIGILVQSDYFMDIYSLGEVNLPKGIFIYRVINNNSVIGSGKILIE